MRGLQRACCFGVVGIEVEQRLPLRDRLDLVTEPLVQRAQLPAQGMLDGGVTGVRRLRAQHDVARVLTLEERHLVDEATLLFIEQLQLVERAVVAGVERDDLLQRGGHQQLLVQLIAVHLGQLDEHGHALGVGQIRVIGLVAQHLGERAPPSLPSTQAAQRPSRPAPAGRGGDGALPRRGGPIGVGGLVDGARGVDQRDGLGGRPDLRAVIPRRVVELAQERAVGRDEPHGIEIGGRAIELAERFPSHGTTQEGGVDLGVFVGRRAQHFVDGAQELVPRSSLATAVAQKREPSDRQATAPQHQRQPPKMLGPAARQKALVKIARHAQRQVGGFAVGRDAQPLLVHAREIVDAVLLLKAPLEQHVRRLAQRIGAQHRRQQALDAGVERRLLRQEADRAQLQGGSLYRWHVGVGGDGQEPLDLGAPLVGRVVDL